MRGLTRGLDRAVASGTEASGTVRRRIKRRGSVQVFEKQCLTIEAERLAGLQVRLERDRRIDVEIKRQAEGDEFRHHHAVDLGPRVGARQLECTVLGRQRVGREPRVGRRAYTRQRQRAWPDSAPQVNAPPRAAARWCATARHSKALRRREAPPACAGEPPVVVHLEEAVARMYPPLQEVRVVLIDGSDVGDAVGIGDELRRRLQAGLGLHVDPGTGLRMKGVTASSAKAAAAM